jgi:phospholipid-translocating ATPase
MTYWTAFNHIVIWGSIAFYFAFVCVMYAPIFEYSYLGTSYTLMATANFWLTMLLTSAVLLTPVVVRKLLLHDTAPTLADKVINVNH